MSYFKKIELNNLVDTGNSTSTPLGIGGVWTGERIDTSKYGTATIGVISDQDSATDGLCICYSKDGINDTQNDVFTILANIGKTFSFGMANRYMKVTYTNGGVEQTSFSIQTIFKSAMIKSSSHRIQDSIVAEDDAELMKSVVTGEDDTGIFINVKVDSTGRMKVVSQPYLFSIAEGTIPNHSPVRRFGHNESVGTSLETVDITSNLYVNLTSAEILKVVSTSANDTSAGTGMQSVFITGLDTNFELQSEIITLNGTTAVNTTKSYIRVLAFYGQSVGTTAGNEGVVDITNNAGTNVLGRIPVGEGRCNAAIFTVPAGYTFYMTKWYGSENSSKGSDITLWKREFGDGGWQMVRLYTILDNVFENTIEVPLVFQEKTDIEIRAKATLAGANVAAGFYGRMELND